MVSNGKINCKNKRWSNTDKVSDDTRGYGKFHKKFIHDSFLFTYLKDETIRYFGQDYNLNGE